MKLKNLLAPIMALYTTFAHPAFARGTDSTNVVKERCGVNVALDPKNPKKLEEICVSAEIGVQYTDYNAQTDEFGVWQVDIVAKRKSDSADLAVLGYNLRVMASPTEDDTKRDSLSTRGDTRDDIFIMAAQLKAIPYVRLSELEYDVRGYEVFTPANYARGTTSGIPAGLTSFPRDGRYFMYSQGSVTISTVTGPVTILLPQLKDGPSYDSFNITGIEGLPLAFNEKKVKDWLTEGILMTEAGRMHPKWGNVSVPQDARAFEAGRRMGSSYAVGGTPGFSEETVDPCATRRTDPCKDLVFERLYLVGIDEQRTTRRGKLVYDVPAASTSVVEIQPWQPLSARYESANLNYATHDMTIEGTVLGGPAGRTLAFPTKRVQDAESGVDVTFQKQAEHYAVVAVLYGYKGIDTNRDGTIAPNEFICYPIAQKAVGLEVDPRGHEPEWFAAGLLVGGAAGFGAGYGLLGTGGATVVIPDLPTTTGSGSLGNSGNVVKGVPP